MKTEFDFSFEEADREQAEIATPVHWLHAMLLD